MDSDLAKHFAKNLKKGKMGKVVAGNLLETQRVEDQKRESRLKKNAEASTEPLSNLLKKTKEDEDWEEIPDQRELDARHSRVNKLGAGATARDGESTSEAGTTAAATEDTLTPGQDHSSSGGAPPSTTAAPMKAGAKSWNMKPATAAPAEEGGDVAAATTTGEKDATAATEDDASADSASAPASQSVAAAAEASSYVPPHLRSKQPGATGPGGKQLRLPGQGKRGTAKQPNINDSEEFPTLGAVAVDVTEKQRQASERSEAEQGWQKAGGGGQQQSTAAGIYQPPRTNTGATAAAVQDPHQYVPPHLRQDSSAQKSRHESSAPPSKYLPPHMRHQEGSTQKTYDGGSSSAFGRRGSNPQLGGGSGSSAWGGGGKSDGAGETAAGRGPTTDLTISNRFGVLGSGQD